MVWLTQRRVYFCHFQGRNQRSMRSAVGHDPNIFLRIFEKALRADDSAGSKIENTEKITTAVFAFDGTKVEGAFALRH